MRSFLKDFWPVIGVFLLIAAWWGYEQIEIDWTRSGTAQTITELKEQIPLDPAFFEFPDVGPFHWRQHEINPTSFIITGKASDPDRLLDWVDRDRSERDLVKNVDTDEVTLVTSLFTSETGYEIYSDGSFTFTFRNPLWE